MAKRQKRRKANWNYLISYYGNVDGVAVASKILKENLCPKNKVEYFDDNLDFQQKLLFKNNKKAKT